MERQVHLIAFTDDIRETVVLKELEGTHQGKKVLCVKRAGFHSRLPSLLFERSHQNNLRHLRSPWYFKPVSIRSRRPHYQPDCLTYASMPDSNESTIPSDFMASSSDRFFHLDSIVPFMQPLPQNVMWLLPLPVPLSTKSL